MPRMPEPAPPTSNRPPQPPARIRPLALALVLWRDHVLLAEGYDEVKGETFYRALGGEIEFGETAAEAAVRELREETGRAIEVHALLGVIENRFTYRGAPGHEVCFELLCEFAPGPSAPGADNAAPANLDAVICDEGGHAFTARWLPLAEVLAGTHRVYPEGTPERLAAWLNTL